MTQSRKFDPDGAFIRRWCPELANLDDDAIHWPHPESIEPSLDFEGASSYPDPIVDHKIQRELALKFLSSISKK